jgi:transcriptional regulator with PAS, ATPase and Fis domain
MTVPTLLDDKKHTVNALIGNSRAIASLREEVELLKRSDAKVLITGESGVGKEVLARAIHRSSRRAQASLVSVNCAGVAESLLESELFGHTKGSFTGAYRDKPGLLETANRGTVFLDEVGEMSMRMQALLLRFLETGEIQPVGSLVPHRALDVRIISATNRGLPAQVESGAFRSDLYYRLNVVHLKIPPLRQRRDDILPLTIHFLNALSEQQQVEPPRLSNEIMQQFLAYAWPGNVRELKNVVERLIVRQSGQQVTSCESLPWSPEAGSHQQDQAGTPVHSVSVADQLFERMVKDGESFWSAVHPAFLLRDLTRDHVRELVSKGLRQARGNYKILLPLFNMKDSDYRRFLTFLRKHELHQPFRRFRAAAVAEISKAEGANFQRRA